MIPNDDPNPGMTRVEAMLKERTAAEAARRKDSAVPAITQYPELPLPGPVGLDPKGEAGAAKLPLRAIPWSVVLEASCGMGEGMIKYGPHNWRTSGGVESMTYVEAAMRHLTAFILGETTDPDSQLPHITKAISTLMVLRDAQINGNAVDNRPPPVPLDTMKHLQDTWARVRPRAAAAAKELQK